jgi:hypothetical protein
LDESKALLEKHIKSIMITDTILNGAMMERYDRNKFNQSEVKQHLIFNEASQIRT